MKMSDVRVGMRLRRTNTGPDEVHMLVTSLTERGFRYSIPADQEVRHPHWSMQMQRDGHEFFAVGMYAIEEVEPGKVYPIPPPPPEEEPRETLGAIEQSMVFVALGWFVASGKGFKPPGWDAIAAALLERLGDNLKACDAFIKQGKTNGT